MNPHIRCELENDETIVTIMTTGNITIHVDISIETTDPHCVVFALSFRPCLIVNTKLTFVLLFSLSCSAQHILNHAYHIYCENFNSNVCPFSAMSKPDWC